MSYVLRSLSYDEEVLVKAKLHFMNYFSRACFMILIFAMLLGCIEVIFQGRDLPSAKIFAIRGTYLFMLFWIFYEILKFRCIEMVCTNKRNIAKRGILIRNTNELRNNKIEAIEIKQSLMGRIFGYGDIWFYGTGTSSVRFAMIKQPVIIKSMIEGYIEQ